MSKVLLTGGAGFIGSHLATALLRNRHKVIVYDSLITGQKENVPKGASLIKEDIRDRSALLDALQGIDYVFHLAAQVSVPRSIDDPKETFDINVKGTLNVIEAVKRSKARKIVFSSSCSVYGDNPKLPLKEGSQLNPLSPYAESKAKGEQLLRASSLPFVAFRYFNVFGPRQRADSAYAAAIPLFFARAKKQAPIIIFGDGTQTRDFVYVKDVAKANLLAMAKGHGIYNICSGKATEINLLASLIIKAVGSRSKLRHEKPRTGDILHSLGDFSKAKKELGWKPTVPLKNGLMSMRP